MDVSSTVSRFMSSQSTNLISSSTGTTSKNLMLKRKESSTVYLDCDEQQSCNKNARRTHSQIEKKRRDKMNSFINELASLVPICNAKSRKLDKLSVLRMAVQHMNMLQGSAGNHYTEVNHKPAFLSDDELKDLIQKLMNKTVLIHGSGTLRGQLGPQPLMETTYQTADGFLFVADCDQGKILFISESVHKILNYSQNDLIGQSLFDYLHPKDILKVKEQLSSAVYVPRKKIIDAKTDPLLKTDINQSYLRPCSGERRSFFCRMRCNQNMEDEDFLSSCSIKDADCKGFCTIYSTGYLKRWAPTEMDLDENNSSCLVAVGRLHPHTLSQPVRNHIKVKPMQFVSRHAIDGRFVFVDQRATAILSYLAQDLLGTSFYEYFHEDDIDHLAECHRQVLQTREKINTNCYKLKIKDGSFITLSSCWFSFMNPWTKEVEFIVSTNTVVTPSGDRPESSYHLPATPPVATVLMPDEDGTALSRDEKPGLQTAPGIPRGTRAGAGNIGQMIAQMLEIQRMDMSTVSSEGQKVLEEAVSSGVCSSGEAGWKERNNQAHNCSTTTLDVASSALPAAGI